MASPAALARLLDGYSIEITPGGKDNAATCREYLPPGTHVYIASPPPDLHRHAVDTAIEVHRAGFVAVPHLAARSLTSRVQLDDVVARLAGEAGVDRILTIGGDVPHPAGPFDSSLQVIESGVLQCHGVNHVGVAFYAEGNPNIDNTVIEQALLAKLAYCAAYALQPYLIGQFCFEAAPLVRRIEALRASGITAALRIGVAGPASRKTLWKYALRCGIGNSIRALGAQTERMTQLLTRDTPEMLLAELVDALGDTHALGIDGVHFFTFGGVGETAGWIRTVLDRAVR